MIIYFFKKIPNTLIFLMQNARCVCHVCHGLGHEAQMKAQEVTTVLEYSVVSNHQMN